MPSLPGLGCLALDTTRQGCVWDEAPVRAACACGYAEGPAEPHHTTQSGEVNQLLLVFVAPAGVHELSPDLSSNSRLCGFSMI